MRCISLIVILFAAPACQKTDKADKSEQSAGFTELGEPYACTEDDASSPPEDFCSSTDETKAFMKACYDAGHRVSRCGCIQLCSSKISAICTEDARIDCIQKADGTYEIQGVGRSGFACAFPPVPNNAVDISFCQP